MTTDIDMTGIDVVRAFPVWVFCQFHTMFIICNDVIVVMAEVLSQKV